MSVYEVSMHVVAGYEVSGHVVSGDEVSGQIVSRNEVSEHERLKMKCLATPVLLARLHCNEVILQNKKQNKK